MRRSLGISALMLSGAVLLGACGSDHSSSSGMDMSDGSGMHHASERNQPVVEGAPEIAVEAGELTFAPKQLNLSAGVDVTIVLSSVDITHDFYVDGIGHVVHAKAGTTAKGGLVIHRPGTYKFWCTVDGHKAGGMVGTITVAASAP